MSGPTTAWAELDDLCEALARLLAVPVAIASVFDDGWQRLHGAYGAPAALAETRATQQVNPLCHQVLRTGKPVIVHDARRRHATGDAALAMFGVVAYAGFPLVGPEGVVIGVIAAIDHHVHSWLPHDIAALRAFGAAASALLARRDGTDRIAALERALAHEVSERALDHGRRAQHTAELLDLAIHDELTGLLNRRGFLAVAEGQLALARRQAMPGVVLFLDVDGLKATNDRAGHAAGDTLLRDAARALRATFRDADTLGRMGGDEFVVFSVASGAVDVPGITTRLAGEVHTINRLRDDDAPLEWSIGFLTFDASDEATLPGMLAEADRRMYVAKQLARG